MKNANLFIPLMQTIGPYCENHKENINSTCRKNKFLILTQAVRIEATERSGLLFRHNILQKFIIEKWTVAHREGVGIFQVGALFKLTPP